MQRRPLVAPPPSPLPLCPVTCADARHSPMLNPSRQSLATGPVTRSGDLPRARVPAGPGVRKRDHMNRLALALTVGAIAFGAGTLLAGQDDPHPHLAPSSDAVSAPPRLPSPSPSGLRSNPTSSPESSPLALPVAVPPSALAASPVHSPVSKPKGDPGPVQAAADAPVRLPAAGPHRNRPAARPAAPHHKPTHSRPAAPAPRYDLGDVCRMAAGRVDPTVLAMCRSQAGG